jgi:hypothetical protein
MALANNSAVTGPSSALSTAKCSIIKLGKARSVWLAFCPLASHIKHWEAKHVSMKGHAATMGPMPQPGVNVLSSRYPVREPLLKALSCSFCPPSGRMVRVEAGTTPVESEGQSSKGTAEMHVGVTSEDSKGIKEPVVDALDLDKPAKRCNVCGYSKLLVDFENTKTTGDKRTEVCRACLAAMKARRLSEGGELYHLELTPNEAWKRAKICKSCGLRKEIRDFSRAHVKKDGTRNKCRSCESNYNKARPAVLPVDTPQRCGNCNEIKPAADYYVGTKRATALYTICKLCLRERGRERYSRLKQSDVIVQRHEKVCTFCGQLKLASDFHKHASSVDGLGYRCKICLKAIKVDRDHLRKARETRAGPPPSK